MSTKTWQVDAARSEIRFILRHLVLSSIWGRVRSWRATLHLNLHDPTQSQVEAVLDASSIETGEPERDAHLRSPEFFNVGKFPEIRFRSRAVTRLDGDRYSLAGQLTIRDVTRDITILVRDGGRRPGATGATRAFFEAETKINRQDFALRWNQDLDTGGVVLGDTVDLRMKIEAEPIINEARAGLR